MSSLSQQSPYHVTINNESRGAAFVRRSGKWRDVEYRQAYMQASIEEGVAWQIKANRKSRGMTQDDLAILLESKQSVVSRLEDPEYGAHSLDTLIKLANAFDCALSVRFVSYAKLASESEDLSEASLAVTTFEADFAAYFGTGESNVDRIRS